MKSQKFLSLDRHFYCIINLEASTEFLVVWSCILFDYFYDMINMFGSSYLLLLQGIVLTFQLTNMDVVFFNDASVTPLGSIGKIWLQKFQPMHFCFLKIIMGNFCEVLTPLFVNYTFMGTIQQKLHTLLSIDWLN